MEEDIDFDPAVVEIAQQYQKSKDLALALGGLFIYEFSQEADIDKKIQTFKEWFPGTSREKILEEYIVLSVAAMVMAIAAHFDGSDEGGHIAVDFSTMLGEDLVRKGIFTSAIDYHTYVDPRVSNYWLASEKDEGNGLNPVYWCGKEACKNFAESEKDLNMPNLMALATIFSKDLVRDKKFIDAIVVD